jgi:hypothetical protein
LLFLLTGCIMGAGTHGSIKSYTYEVPKDTLQKAIMNIIEHDPNIHRDTSLDYLGSSPLLDSGALGNYSANDNFYNDIKHYVTISIMSGPDTNEYTFRYYGPDEQWKTENSSGIFICYAYDRHRNGGSEGNGGVTWRTPSLKKKLTSVFEKELMSKVDKALKMNHTEE